MGCLLSKCYSCLECNENKRGTVISYNGNKEYKENLLQDESSFTFEESNSTYVDNYTYRKEVNPYNDRGYVSL